MTVYIDPSFAAALHAIQTIRDGVCDLPEDRKIPIRDLALLFDASLDRLIRALPGVGLMRQDIARAYRGPVLIPQAANQNWSTEP